MPRLANPSLGPKGVWIAERGALMGGSTVWVEPNEYVDVEKLTDGERASFIASGGVVIDDPMDPDGDGKMGGAVHPPEPVLGEPGFTDTPPPPRRGRPPKVRG
jgi:hypothetical protein